MGDGLNWNLGENTGLHEEKLSFDFAFISSANNKSHALPPITQEERKNVKE